jgi:hypothetical protein
MLVVFKAILVIGAVVVVRLFVLSQRSRGLERILILVACVGGAVAVIYPPITQWAAELVGITRGVDLMFYLAFMLAFVLLGAQRRLIRAHEAALTELVREVALANAKRPDDRA